MKRQMTTVYPCGLNKRCVIQNSFNIIKYIKRNQKKTEVNCAQILMTITTKMKKIGQDFKIITLPHLRNLDKIKRYININSMLIEYCFLHNTKYFKLKT